MMFMMNYLKEHAPSFLKDTFYDLTILVFSHVLYQLIAQILG